MEEDIHTYSASPTKTAVKVEERLEAAVDKASKKLQYESAHDEELLQALTVVAEFIKNKKRVCYGGTAMNALLPDSKKFYNPEYDLPDYDFYTPDMEGDVKSLVEMLNKAGFKDVYHKVGIHEGTKKILVNFTAVADVSAIEPDLFDILLKRSVVKEGVHYTDENILRMMMYLELSRPKGMVERWKKVFERLNLINSMFPIHGCSRLEKARSKIPLSLRTGIIEYIIEWKRVLCNGNLIPLITQGIRKGKAVFRIQEGPAPMFTSPDPKLDAVALKRYLKDESITLHRIASRGEIVPERVELKRGGESICMIVGEIACHSFLTLPVKGGGTIFIGSLEFLITLYLSLSIFTNQSPEYLGGNVLCQVSQFIRLLNENYTAKKSQFEPFALECRGHQTKFTSLLRQKVERIKREKEGAESSSSIQTRKSAAKKGKSATRKIRTRK